MSCFDPSVSLTIPSTATSTCCFAETDRCGACLVIGCEALTCCQRLVSTSSPKSFEHFCLKQSQHLLHLLLWQVLISVLACKRHQDGTTACNVPSTWQLYTSSSLLSRHSWKGMCRLYQSMLLPCLSHQLRTSSVRRCSLQSITGPGDSFEWHPRILVLLVAHGLLLVSDPRNTSLLSSACCDNVRRDPWPFDSL